ncbi:hypothetical protein [Sphingosinithalassobacter sp. LHW66-3]|uniref:hypothetical protein n=1 Tax=Sphingosinithalassobacter sp. LHW66-3 TaxID=3424718 RepID=UPI003D6A85DE
MKLPAIRIDRDALREGLRRRGPGFVLALLVEGLLALLLLTIVPQITRDEVPVMEVFSVDPGSEGASAPEPEPQPESAPAEAAEQVPEPPVPEPQVDSAPTPLERIAPHPVPSPPPLIRLDPDAMASADIARPRAAAPSRAAPRVSGPPNPGPRPGWGDTPRAEGSGPNGEPLYAAAWYREPYESEMRGYLQTVQGQGYGVIACRTVPEYRVEDCVPVTEYPEGSGYLRAVLAMAWQFRVRPPRLGGQLRYGEWVRIRIERSGPPR